MNARTWGTIFGLSIPAFIFAALSQISSSPQLESLRGVSFALLASLGLSGAWFGLLLAFDRLFLGCPFCSQRSKVVGGEKHHLQLDCPSCGDVVLTMRAFRTPVATKGSIEDLDSERRRELLSQISVKSSRALLKTRRFWLCLGVIWLPGLTAITVRLSTAPALGPAIGGLVFSAVLTMFLTDSLLLKYVSLNLGTWFRETEPMRYWTAMIFLGLCYGLIIFAVLKAR